MYLCVCVCEFRFFVHLRYIAQGQIHAFLLNRETNFTIINKVAPQIESLTDAYQQSYADKSIILCQKSLNRLHHFADAVVHTKQRLFRLK